MRRNGLFVLQVAVVHAVFGITYAGASSAAKPGNERLYEFLDAQYNEAVRRSPMLATEFNDLTGYDRWDDVSEAALTAQAAADERALAVAESSFDSVVLDPVGLLQRQIFIDQQHLLLDRFRWRNHFYALNQVIGLHIAVPDMLTNQQPMATEADAQAYIRRLRAVEPLFAQLIARMHQQKRAGVYMPRSVYPLLIGAARNVVRGEPYTRGTESPIYADFRRRVGELPLDTRDRDRLLRDCRAALLGQVGPAYSRLIVDLTAQASRSKIDGGVWQLPDGDAFYAFLVRQFTTTDLSPEEIHALGLREVARLQGEMATLLRKLGFTGTFREFVARTKSDPKFYEPNTDEGREHYLARARAIVDVMQSRTTEAFFRPRHCHSKCGARNCSRRLLHRQDITREVQPMVFVLESFI